MFLYIVAEMMSLLAENSSLTVYEKSIIKFNVLISHINADNPVKYLSSLLRSVQLESILFCSAQLFLSCK